MYRCDSHGLEVGLKSQSDRIHSIKREEGEHAILYERYERFREFDLAPNKYSNCLDECDECYIG